MKPLFIGWEAVRAAEDCDDIVLRHEDGGVLDIAEATRLLTEEPDYPELVQGDYPEEVIEDCVEVDEWRATELAYHYRMNGY